MNLNKKVNLKIKSHSHLVKKWENLGCKCKCVFLTFNCVKDMRLVKNELDKSKLFKTDIMPDHTKMMNISTKLRVKEGK